MRRLTALLQLLLLLTATTVRATGLCAADGGPTPAAATEVAAPAPAIAEPATAAHGHGAHATDHQGHVPAPTPAGEHGDGDCPTMVGCAPSLPVTSVAGLASLPRTAQVPAPSTDRAPKSTPVVPEPPPPKR